MLEESNTLEAHCSPLLFDFFSRSCGRHKRCKRKAIPSRPVALLFFSNYFRVEKINALQTDCSPFGEIFAATRLARTHLYILSEMFTRSSGQHKQCKARAVPPRPIAPPFRQIFAATSLARIHPYILNEVVFASMRPARKMQIESNPLQLDCLPFLSNVCGHEAALIHRYILRDFFPR